MKKVSYLMLLDSLPDGDYMSSDSSRWHEKLRLKICKWLFQSIKRPHQMSIRRTTSTSLKGLK